MSRSHRSGLAAGECRELQSGSGPRMDLDCLSTSNYTLPGSLRGSGREILWKAEGIRGTKEDKHRQNNDSKKRARGWSSYSVKASGRTGKAEFCRELKPQAEAQLSPPSTGAPPCRLRQMPYRALATSDASAVPRQRQKRRHV